MGINPKPIIDMEAQTVTHVYTFTPADMSLVQVAAREAADFEAALLDLVTIHQAPPLVVRASFSHFCTTSPYDWRTSYGIARVTSYWLPEEYRGHGLTDGMSEAFSRFAVTAAEAAAAIREAFRIGGWLVDGIKDGIRPGRLRFRPPRREARRAHSRKVKRGRR